MDGKCCFEDFAEHLSHYVGQTVTIYTTSGGASGCGLTGVILMCNPCFVRLVTCFGPAPCCALGSQCNICGCPCFSGCKGGTVRTVGSVADIPIDRIASFVHCAI